MAKLRTNSGANPGMTATVGGIAGALPGINIFAPGIAAALGAEDEKALRELMADNAAGLELPSFDKNPYQHETYVGDYEPEAYGDPILAEAKTAQIDPKLRAAQLAAIEQLASLGNGAAAAGLDADRAEGLYEAETSARGMNDALEQEAAARGIGGGAGELGRRQAANSTAANRSARSSLEAARQAAIMKLASEQAHTGALSNLRDQDQSLEVGNTDIVNAFNRANTDIMNQVKMANTTARNEAHQGNLGRRQQVMNTNTTADNASKDRDDASKQRDFQDRFAQMQAVNAALNGSADSMGRNVTAANEAGKTGYSNYKDLMSMMAGGMGGGGGMMGMMGGGG